MQFEMEAHVQERIEPLLREGRKIEAIKMYREIKGVGLKEAKDAVERYERELIRRGPEQLDSTPHSTKPLKPTGCSGVLLGMLVVILFISSLVAIVL
jgi:hypothetical protein